MSKKRMVLIVVCACEEDVALISQVPLSSGSCEESFTLRCLGLCFCFCMLPSVSLNGQDQTWLVDSVWRKGLDCCCLPLMLSDMLLCWVPGLTSHNACWEVFVVCPQPIWHRLHVLPGTDGARPPAPFSSGQCFCLCFCFNCRPLIFRLVTFALFLSLLCTILSPPTDRMALKLRMLQGHFPLSVANFKHFQLVQTNEKQIFDILFWTWCVVGYSRSRVTTGFSSWKWLTLSCILLTAWEGNFYSCDKHRL